MVWLSGGGELALCLANLYVMIPLHSFTFFRRRLAAWYAAFAFAAAAPLCYPLDVMPVPYALSGLGISVISASVVGWLVRLAERAERDSVTGLLNRRGFERVLDQWLVDARHEPHPFSVGHLDL